MFLLPYNSSFKVVLLVGNSKRFDKCNCLSKLTSEPSFVCLKNNEIETLLDHTNLSICSLEF